MTTLQNDIFLKALRCEPVSRTPIWIMRQAGRYLPEYRATRAKAGDFMSLCKNTDFATEVTLQPLDRFDLDAAILFSDILTIPDALGLGLYFETGEGPKFKNPLTDARSIQNLPRIDVNTDLQYVMNAVSSIKKALNGRVPLIGFSGSPWTLACYMIQGEGSRDFAKVKKVMYGQPELMHQLLDFLSDIVSDYLLAQIEAGADAVQIFDTWGGLLSESAYRDFSLRSMERIIERIKPTGVPIIMFTKGAGSWMHLIKGAGADCVGLDWMMNLGRARDQLGDNIAVQGNLDPSFLLTDEEKIDEQVARILGENHGRPGHIFNLGHGITPQVNPELVKFLVDRVHDLSFLQES